MCGRCCRTRPTRSSIGTASSWSEVGVGGCPATLVCMAVTTTTVAASCAAAKQAARALASASTASKNAALEATARLLEERTEEILEANVADLADERAVGLTAALRDRLALSAERVAAMAAGVRVVSDLDDPVGEELEHKPLAR